VSLFPPVVGHAHAQELLARSLASGAVHTCYLFWGPPGVGKRLLADAFLRAALCAAGGAAPCGHCRSCTLYGGGAHPDLLVVTPVEDKKSISVDQARDLGEWLSRTPALGTRKAVIVDPADALTDHAANALLKTLEEPPKGSLIVLVAARAGALPPTILSRTQQIALGALSDDEVARVLGRNGWPGQAARQAAALAEGSPGVALARDGRAWQESADAVRAVLERLEAGDRGAALEFAERVGEGREKAVAALQAVIATARAAARDRLGAAEGSPAAGPAPLSGLDTAGVCDLLEGALRTHRRLDDADRPPNVKLALATLLARAVPAGAAQP
jgi:DNA polymerase-3 subunit delta'